MKNELRPVADRPHAITEFATSLTKQNHRDECNINTILERYRRTGLVTHVNNAKAQYGDFSNIVDYRTALDTISEAETLFMQLPARVRARFENDPSAFMEFAMDPSNLPEMIEMGLAEPPPPPKEDPEPPVTPQEVNTESPPNGGSSQK